MERGIRLSSEFLITVLAVTVAVLAVTILTAPATWSVRAVAVSLAVYLVLSLFFHPTHSIRHDPFAIHNFTRLTVLVGFAINGTFVASDPYAPTDAFILTTLGIALATMILADLGVALVPTAPLTTQKHHPESGLESRTLLILAVVGWLWRGYAFTHGLLQGTLIGTKLELTGASNAFGTLNALAGVAMWGCLIFFRRPSRALPLAIAEVFWLVVTGSKSATIYVIVPVAMILQRRGIISINRRFVASAVALLAVFVTSFVLIHSYRVAVTKQIYAVGYENLSPTRALRDIEASPDDFQLVGQALTKRLNFCERLLLILEDDQRQDRPSLLGESYLYSLIWGIPRALWPDKPSMSLGRYFATEYLGWSEASRSEIGVTIWGEGYMNFGLLGSMLLPPVWLTILQAIYVYGVGAGRWGIYFVGASFMLMVNSLAANVALPIASLSQLALFIGILRVGISAIRTTRRHCEVRIHV